MPYIVYPQEGFRGVGTGNQDLSRMNFDYEYPEGLNLKPGSKLHEKIKQEILMRAYDSAAIISKRFDSWNDIDKVLTSYVRMDSEEEKIKEKDDRKPVSIVFPNSYAIMESLMAYLMSAFLQEPVIGYEATRPGALIGAILLEKVVNQHIYYTKVPLALHTFFRDGLAYGFGLGAPGWTREYGAQYVEQNLGKSFLGFSKGTQKVLEENSLIFEGNSLDNIDPYMSLPDPNVPIHKIQEGEFFGWMERTNYSNLLGQEKNDDNLFNVKYLKGLTNRTSALIKDPSQREVKTGGRSESFQNHVTPCDRINMFINLIPKDWEMGDGEYPEKWKFSLVSDEIVVEARPTGFHHDRYPVISCAPDFDGYSTTPISRLEALNGLQGLLDWLFNAHIANVRKIVNDTLIVDPYLVNIKDLETGKPGGIARLRRPAWGRGVKDAVHQLGVSDVTRQHIQDGSFISQFMSAVSGIDDSAAGMLRSGGPERLTKAEFQGTRFGTFSRLEKIARIIGYQGMQDLGFFFGFHTQQMMSQSSYVSALGSWQKTLLREFGAGDVYKNGGLIEVDPDTIRIPWSLKVRDGSIPGGNFSEVWVRLFEIMAKEPELHQQFDIVRVFKHIARNLGAKNVDQFERVNVNTMPNEQIINERDKGNIIPLDQYMEAGQ